MCTSSLGTTLTFSTWLWGNTRNHQ